ncbi:hypothetical protein PENTCL1PPCAC_146, partial [Pristionchus entomophagus]
QTKSCLDSYFSGFGLNPDNLPQYATYIGKLLDLTTKYGADGVNMFCSLEQVAEDCLGGLLNSPCMTAAAFQQMYGMSVTDSYEYATDFPVRAYMCKNKQVMDDNLVCFDDVHLKHLDERKKCTTDLENAMAKVTDGDYCKPWGPFVTCNDDVYVKYCGAQVKGSVCI